MIVKNKGIVLRTIPYNDRYQLVHILTEDYGRCIYHVPRARGKHSKFPSIMFTPLSLLELEANHRNTENIHRLKEAKIEMPLMNILSDPIKSTISIFLAELLFHISQYREMDKKLFLFIRESILFLEINEGSNANFHIVFMLHLLRYLGIELYKSQYKKGYYLDMRNGEFVSTPPPHTQFLNKKETRIAISLLRMSFRNMEAFCFSAAERNLIIDRGLEYYHVHIPELPELKSLPILRDIFK